MQHTITETEATKETKRYQCRHIFTDGHRCGSASLRSEQFCYYHHTTRKPVANPRQRRSRRSTFNLPLPEDRSAIQLSIGQVLQRIAANDIDPRRAGLLLYGLQIASLNLPRQHPKLREIEVETVEEVVAEPELGNLAPSTEMPHRQKSILSELLDNLKGLEDDPRPGQQPEWPIPGAPDNANIEEFTAVTQETEEAPQPVTETNAAAKTEEETAILPGIQATAANLSSGQRCRRALKIRRPTHPRSNPQAKSPKKLTQPSQLDIVRGFREYPDRVVGNSQHAEGGEKPRPLQHFPVE